MIYFLTLFLFISLCYSESQTNMSSSTVFITSTTQDNLFFFDQKKWNIVVERIENNLPLFEEEKTTVTTKPPVITPTTIEFMEGTQLSIAGRKLIGMEIKNVQYPYRKEFNRTDVNMKQELQVSVRGKVGKNVDVNIDIDDTQPDKRDISIIYRGEGVDVTPGAVGYKARPGAFIQEIAFGDIQLSLPNTEFVGYSRQVFGLKAVGQYKNAKLYLIASQSKGNFETKRFTGKLEFERKLLYDTSYVRRKYYKVAFGNYKIKKDSIKVYIDTLDPQRDPATLVSMTVQSFNLSTFTYTGKFEQLALGRDFIVDYAKGIIVFNLPTGSIQPHWVIAVDYIDENTNLSLRELKNTTNYILIKDKDENPEVTTELKNRYSIGRTNIVRDDGAGNFLLKITDKTDRILNPTYDKIQPGDKTVPVYKTGNMGDIIMDFENGEFYFLTEEPFVDDCYDKNPISRYNILIEYKYRLKTYFLKPFIVPYSERISVDGKLLQRNVDYWIDYDSGFINFLKEDIINENSVIEASYEYSMLGLQGGETLAGGRIELPLHRKLFVGSSWIGNLPSKGTNVPDIRNTPGSLQVWEADARILDIKFPFIPFKINSVSAEYAENEKNPNIWDKAIVENMEGITLEDSVSTYRHMWSYGSCSDIYIPGKYDEKLDKLVGGELFWDNEDVPTKEINPKRETTLEKQQVLRVNYDLYSSSEVAMVYTFSKTGLDFTKKLYIEIEYYSNNGGGELYLDIGQVNEDIDNDGTLDTEDKNLNGRLDIDEDSGFSYNAKSNQIYMVGSKNGRLDTEDLDADGILNTVERIGGRYKISDLNFTGWVSTIVAVQVTEKNIWSTVKHLKLSIRGHKKTGVIKISKISVVGNKFQIITPGNTKVFAVNNENDPSYKKLSELEDYSSIYGSMYEQTKIEQALAIEYDFDTYASSSIVNILFSRSQDFTYHHKLNFFIYNKTKNNIIVKYIAYTDANNFYEYLREIKNINLDEWIKCSIEQTDTNMDNIPDTWEADDNDISIKCSKIGKPNLQTITKLEIVIINPLNTPQKGIVYINDIYLSDSWKRKGIARKYDANFSVPGWVNFGLTFREVDRRFETFTSAITNQDNTSISGYFGLIKLGFLPIDFKGRQELTVTPSAIKAGELISKYQEGKRIYTEGSLSTSLIIPKFPTLNLAYTKSISSTTALSRTDMKDNIRLAFSYRNPIFKYVPIETISFTYGEEKFLLYPWVTALSTFTPSVDDSKYTSFNLPFNFWNKLKLNLNVGTKNTFTELRNFNISVGEYIKTPMLTVDKDIWNYYTNLTFFTLYNLERTYQIYYTSYSVVVSSYEKRNENNFSLDSSIELIPFLKPNLGYKVDIIEDYNFPISNRKDITRNSGGNFSISLTPKDFVRLKQIQTLRFTYNFNLTAADRYEKLPKNNRSLNFYTFDNLDLLWYKTSVSTANFFVTRAIERKEQRLNTSWKLFEGLPFKGNVAFLKKTDMNLSYSDAVEEKEETQTKTFTYTKVWPDMTFTLYDFDTLLNYILRKSKVFRDTKLDLSYSYKTTEIKKVSLEENKRHREMISFSFFEKYNMLINYENTNTTNFSFLLKIRTSYSSTDNLVFQFGMPFFGQRLTPKYEFRREIVKDARNLTTRDITTNSFSVSYYADIVPKQGGINIFGKTLPLQNRLRINSGLNYTRRESPIDIGKNNTDNFGFNARGDYDVSKYINVSVGVGTELNINRIIKTDTNYSFNINGQVIIRF